MLRERHGLAAVDLRAEHERRRGCRSGRPGRSRGTSSGRCCVPLFVTVRVTASRPASATAGRRRLERPDPGEREPRGDGQDDDEQDDPADRDAVDLRARRRRAGRAGCSARTARRRSRTGRAAADARRGSARAWRRRRSAGDGRGAWSRPDGATNRRADLPAAGRLDQRVDIVRSSGPARSRRRRRPPASAPRSRAAPGPTACRRSTRRPASRPGTRR